MSVTKIPSWDCQLIQHDYSGPSTRLPIDGRKADLIFADPPYNIGVKYADDPTKDKMTPEQYQQFTLDTLATLLASARGGATLWWMVPEEHADWVGEMLTRIVGPRLYRIVWEEAFAQYQGNRALTKDYRFIFVHRVASDGVVTFNPDDIRIPSARQEVYKDKRANSKGRVPGCRWTFPSSISYKEMADCIMETMKLEPNALSDRWESRVRLMIEDGLRTYDQTQLVDPGCIWKVRRLQGTSRDRVDWHPCQLPPEMLVRIVKGWSNPGDLVIDAFAGSGSLGKVCRELNRGFVGVDRSATYIGKMAEEMA